MSEEDNYFDMLLEQAQLLEQSNMTEMMTTRVQAFWNQQKLDMEQDFSPAEKFILEQAGNIKK